MSFPCLYTGLCQIKTSLFHVVVKGGDAFRFLQGQSTQLLDSELKFHAFIERTGKVVCHFLASQRNDNISLWVHPWALEALLDRFDKFVISEDVQWSHSLNENVYISFNNYSHHSELRGQWAGVEVALSESPFPHTPLISENEYKRWCLWQGVPELSDESLKGEVINQTVLLNYALDFKKGCFPGQEAVAKINNLKGAAWAPVLFFKTTAQDFPTELKVDNKSVAQINLESVEGDWAQGRALRDVRVQHLILEQHFMVRLYPRWPIHAPERASELYHQGAEAFQKGNEEEALELWKLSLKIDPNFPESYEAIGVLLGRQEKFVEAESWMRDLLMVDPDSIMAHTNLSLFLMRQDKIEEAEKHKALATVASFKSFGKAASDKKEQEAKKAQELAELSRREDMFRQVLEIDPEDTLALNGMGSILMEKAQPMEALDYFLQVIRADEKYSVAYLSLGKCYVALGDRDKAQEVLQKGVKIAAQKGDLMPANEMQTILLSLN